MILIWTFVVDSASISLVNKSLNIRHCLCHKLSAGNKVEKLCDLCNITVNKNAVFGDSSALAPGGVRIGKDFENHILV